MKLFIRLITFFIPSKKLRKAARSRLNQYLYLLRLKCKTIFMSDEDKQQISRSHWENREIYDYENNHSIKYDLQVSFLKRIVIPNLNKSDKVLDVACADGWVSNIIAPHVKELKGIDISQSLLDTARKKSDELGVSNVVYEKVDLTTTPIESSYTQILALGFFNCITTDEMMKKILKNFKEILCDDGLLVVKERVASISESEELIYDGFAQRNRSANLNINIFKESGFEIVEKEIAEGASGNDKNESQNLLFATLKKIK